jgi:GDPmannose 4,6-dehydratase
MKKALITGITGQDGSYLAELLLSKGYEVHGLVRRSSTPSTWRIEHLLKTPGEYRLTLHHGNLLDASALERLVHEVEPDEIYNLAAQSHVLASFSEPLYTSDVNALGTLRLLQAVLNLGLEKTTRFYQASSSEMFGLVQEVPQTEKTPLHPRSPYGCSKVAAHYQVINYREAYGMHATSGLLFNHESPRRGHLFVTRKITQGIANIVAGKQKKIYLGNLEARRDWGYAKDYVEAMWLMLQQETADDYVISTGETHSIKEFLSEAFGLVNLNWQDYIEIDPRFFRKAEVDLLIGDASKAKRQLGWEATTKFSELVRIMLAADLSAQGIELEEKASVDCV